MIQINRYKSLWSLIPKNQKKKSILLFFLVLFGMILEVFGLGVLLPIVIGLLDVSQVKDFIELNFSFLVPYTENFSDEMFIYIGLSCLVILYVFKSFYLAFLAFFQNDYLTKIVKYNSNKLFLKFFDQDYTFFLKKNSSEIIKLFQIELNYLIYYMSAMSYVITELCMTLAIVLTLILIEPIGALMVSVFFGSMSYFFFSIFKERLTKYGILREEYDGNLSKNILESFHSVKEIKLTNSFKYFFKVHKENNSKRTKVTRNELFVGQLPRLFLEVIAVVGLSIFILVLIWQGFNKNELISILTIFVAATFRLVPSINRVLNSVQTMRFHQTTIDILNKEFLILKDKVTCIKDQEIKNDRISSIKLENLSFSYNNRREKILDKISLDIKIGSTIGIIGTSGSGKTTFLDVLIGLIRPDSGKIFINDESLQENNMVHWRKNIGYVSQFITLLDDSIRKNIAFGIELNEIDEKKLQDCLDKAQLKEFVDSLENGINTIIGERGIELSGGQRQRIGIARALYNNPEILIFDEATSALDEKTEEQFIHAIEKFKNEKTIIIITHRLSTLRFCNRVYSLEKGKLKEKKFINEIL